MKGGLRNYSLSIASFCFLQLLELGLQLLLALSKLRLLLFELLQSVLELLVLLLKLLKHVFLVRRVLALLKN